MNKTGAEIVQRNGNVHRAELLQRPDRRGVGCKTDSVSSSSMHDVGNRHSASSAFNLSTKR
jgi:hypothetical protein